MKTNNGLKHQSKELSRQLVNWMMLPSKFPSLKRKKLVMVKEFLVTPKVLEVRIKKLRSLIDELSVFLREILEKVWLRRQIKALSDKKLWKTSYKVKSKTKMRCSGN